MNPDETFWSGRRVLVTGHTGFKGAWLVALLRSMGAEVAGLALAPDPRGVFTVLQADPAMTSVLGDIRDRDLLRTVLEDHRPEVVFHLAAQALVKESYRDPVETFDVNVIGTAAVLDAADAADGVRVVVVVTSDKVYANDESGRRFVESDALGGGDPYSASKSAAEMVVASWQHRHVAGRPVVVAARAGNVIGGGDRAADRLLPDLYRAAEAGVPLEVRNPEAIRPWQFVLEPVVGYAQYAEAAWNDPSGAPRALNFGPDDASCWSVRRIVDAVSVDLGSDAWREVPDPRADQKEAGVLRLDASAAADAIGWRPRLELRDALTWTSAWYLAERAGDPLDQLIAQQIGDYLGMDA